MEIDTMARPRITKTIGVIDAPNLLKVSGGWTENGLRMVPIVFTSDRELMDRTLAVTTERGRKAEVLFEDVENLVKYVTSVNVNVYKGTPLDLKQLVVRPSIVVIDKNLAQTLGVEIRKSSIQEAMIAEIMRS